MSVTQPNVYNTSEHNYDQIFDEDVQRFEATEYKQRYGDRWKKLATSVRDVVQPDGTIIREYVIEDPSLLEQLSEDEENVSSLDTKTINKSTNPVTTPNNNNNNNIANNSNNSSNLTKGQNSLPLKTNNLKTTSSFKLYSNNSNNKTNIANDKDENYFQPINKKEEEEVDKEVEIIHEQGKKKFIIFFNLIIYLEKVNAPLVDELLEDICVFSSPSCSSSSFSYS